MRAFVKFKTTRTERQLLRMQAASNGIFLKDGEDVKKLEDLQNSTLKELLTYQGDSSNFDIDEQKAVLENIPPDLSDKNLKLFNGFFPKNSKSMSNLNES